MLIPTTYFCFTTSIFCLSSTLWISLQSSDVVLWKRVNQVNSAACYIYDASKSCKTKMQLWKQTVSSFQPFFSFSFLIFVFFLDCMPLSTESLEKFSLEKFLLKSDKVSALKLDMIEKNISYYWFCLPYTNDNSK